MSSSAATFASTLAPSITVRSPRGERAATANAAVCGIAASSLANMPCSAGITWDTLPMSVDPARALGSYGVTVRPRRVASNAK